MENCGVDAKVEQKLRALDINLHKHTYEKTAISDVIVAQNPNYPDIFQFAKTNPITHSNWVAEFRAAHNSQQSIKTTQRSRFFNQPIIPSANLVSNSVQEDQIYDKDFSLSAYALLQQLSHEDDRKLQQSRFLKYLRETSKIHLREDFIAEKEPEGTTENEWDDWNAVKRDWITKESTGLGYLENARDMSTDYQFLFDEDERIDIYRDALHLERLCQSEEVHSDAWLELGKFSLLNDDDFNAIAALSVTSSPKAILFRATAFVNQSFTPNAIECVYEWYKLKFKNLEQNTNLSSLANLILNKLEFHDDLESIRAKCILWNCLDKAQQILNCTDHILKSEDVFLINTLAASLSNAGQYRQAITIYEGILKHQVLPRVLMNLAIAYFHSENHIKVEETLKQYELYSKRSQKSIKSNKDIINAVRGVYLH